jgi:hypothetical protein
MFNEKRKARFLTKVRMRGPIHGRCIVKYCENCRIKDGLERHSYIALETCSFCGRKTRCYRGMSPWNHGTTVANPRIRGPSWHWKRGPAIWKDHSLR